MALNSEFESAKTDSIKDFPKEQEYGEKLKELAHLNAELSKGNFATQQVEEHIKKSTEQVKN